MTTRGGVREGRRRSADGRLLLSTRQWPAEHPHAALLIVHGLGEHAGRYDRLAGEVAAQGVSVLAYDQRGHGRAQGQRGHVSRFELLLQDLDVMVAWAGEEAAGRPLFLMGHSFGGLVALRWLQTRGPGRLVGAVISAPLLEVALQPPRWKVAASGFLSRWAPALPFSNEIDPESLSRVEAYVRSYRDDPLVHDRVTPRLYTEMMAAAVSARDQPMPDAFPLLFVIPGRDRICLSAATERFAGALTGDVTVRHYPEARHEAFNDVEREAVVADIVGWLARRM